ncbi:MAG: hypothetical protein AAFQ94_06680 [Bacteroidota bacterium]
MNERTKQFHKALVERLASTKLDEKLLKNSSESIAVAYGKGIRWQDVFPLGITDPDGIGVIGRVSINNVGRIKDLFKNELLKEIKVFPKGIIAPEYLEVHASFSEKVTQR